MHGKIKIRDSTGQWHTIATPRPRIIAPADDKEAGYDADVSDESSEGERRGSLEGTGELMIAFWYPEESDEV